MPGLLALLLCLWSTAAHADGDVVAGRRHFERARAFVRLGDHRSAIREFEAAYQADPRPNLLFNIAQQHRILAQTGSLVELRSAAAFFQRYLKEKPNAEDRRQVEEYLADLRARIEAGERASLDTSTRAERDPAPGARTSPDDGAATRALPAAPSTGPSPPRGRVPAWGWGLIGVGSLVVVGGAVGLGLWLAPGEAPPTTSLGGFGAN